MAGWVKRNYGKGEIDRAGSDLIPWWTRPDDPSAEPSNLGKCYMIIQNWRSSHGLPLNVFQACLRSRAARVEANVLVAQRMKRFSSVMNKLVREPRMKLSQMHDLAGCRAILTTVSAVDNLYGMYRGDEPLFAAEASIKAYDYIRAPKEDGYRGIHIVGRYQARSESREVWNGHRVEIQLRSQLQHAFATAVETVTTFTREPLKFGAGPVKWKRFFSLMGSALAVRENTPLLKGTPRDEDSLIRELREVARELKVQKRLGGWTHAVRTLPQENITNFNWLLMVLNTKTSTVSVTGYASRAAATSAISDIEKSRNEDLDAVLVWVKSISDLRAAYPNYYADTRDFITALESALSTKARKKS